MSDFRLLITGASGFIGTNFVDYILNENNFEFINIDQNLKEKRQKNLAKIKVKKANVFNWWTTYGGTI